MRKYIVKINELFIYMCIMCLYMCVIVCVYTCAHTHGSQKLMMGIGQPLSSLQMLRKVLLLEARVFQLSLGIQFALGIPYFC